MELLVFGHSYIVWHLLTVPALVTSSDYVCLVRCRMIALRWALEKPWSEDDGQNAVVVVQGMQSYANKLIMTSSISLNFCKIRNVKSFIIEMVQSSLSYYVLKEVSDNQVVSCVIQIMISSKQESHLRLWPKKSAINSLPACEFHVDKRIEEIKKKCRMVYWELGK